MGLPAWGVKGQRIEMAGHGRRTYRNLRPMTTSGNPLHKEVLQWFGECTRELGIAPLASIS